MIETICSSFRFTPDSETALPCRSDGRHAGKCGQGLLKIAFCRAKLCLCLSAGIRPILGLPERRDSAAGGNDYETCDISAIEQQRRIR